MGEGEEDKREPFLPGTLNKEREGVFPYPLFSSDEVPEPALFQRGGIHHICFKSNNNKRIIFVQLSNFSSASVGGRL